MDEKEKDMLVLTRRIGQRTRIRLPDGRICWEVILDVDRNRVRIGYLFPHDVGIHREELIERARQLDEEDDQ